MPRLSKFIWLLTVKLALTGWLIYAGFVFGVLAAIGSSSKMWFEVAEFSLMSTLGLAGALSISFSKGVSRIAVLAATITGGFMLYLRYT